ncbi:MAG TPA: hypothetical protein VMZ26_02835, partial [Pyrinomonadaceae bacterium]|nr:hypothetical protein [Pyrinomonadaceae bacterium]
IVLLGVWAKGEIPARNTSSAEAKFLNIFLIVVPVAKVLLRSGRRYPMPPCTVICEEVSPRI